MKKTNTVIFYRYITDMFSNRKIGKPIIDFTDTRHDDDTDED